METHSGVAVSPGIAIGQVFLLATEERNVPERRIEADEADVELQRLDQAVELAKRDLGTLRENLGMDSEIAGIFAAHDMVLADRTLRAELERVVRQRLVSAECAVAEVFDALVQRFENLDEAYFAQRASDMRDIERRLLRFLLVDRGEELARLEGGAVIAAHDLTPSQTASLNREQALGFITDVGGRTSHTAIIARSLGLPAVVGLGGVIASLEDGMIVIVDGTTGQVVIDPEPLIVERYQRMSGDFRRRQAALLNIRSLPSETLDGHTIRLYGNIERPEDVLAVHEAGGDGVGLFRTEFLFEVGQPPPTEEDHYNAYLSALKELRGRPLTIRTLDFGADKFTPDAAASLESNPALGSRSIRLCLERPTLFMPQLRAILRVASQGDVRILFPMISSLIELRSARQLLDRARVSLRTEGHSVEANLPVGVMIEIPSAAIAVDLLVAEVDFLCVGTNDLVQYTLAVDRTNERVAHLYRPVHPALLRLLAGVIECGTNNDTPVSVCGEMAGDPLYTVLLIGMGLRELSLPPRFLPEIKYVVRGINVEQSREAASWCVQAGDTQEVEQRLRDVMREILPH